MPKKLLSLIFSLIFLCLTGCGEKYAQTLSKEEVLELIRASNVRLICEAGSESGGSVSSKGSGVVIETYGDYVLIATASHLFEYGDEAIVSFYQNGTAFGRVDYIDTGRDVAIVKIDKADLDASFLETLVAARLSDDAGYEVKIDESVYLVGSSVSVGANMSEGIIKSKDYIVPEFDENLLYLYADAMPGMSGGGVFTKDGYLIGIIAAGSDASEVLAIPITEYINIGGYDDDKD